MERKRSYLYESKLAMIQACACAFCLAFILRISTGISSAKRGIIDSIMQDGVLFYVDVIPWQSFWRKPCLMSGLDNTSLHHFYKSGVMRIRQTYREYSPARCYTMTAVNLDACTKIWLS
jgi:hypothetical protein